MGAEAYAESVILLADLWALLRHELLYEFLVVYRLHIKPLAIRVFKEVRLSNCTDMNIFISAANLTNRTAEGACGHGHRFSNRGQSGTLRVTRFYLWGFGSQDTGRIPIMMSNVG